MTPREIISNLVIEFEEIRDISEGRYPPPNAGCIECTVGTVPNRLNKGLCAYHSAKEFLRPSTLYTEVICRKGHETITLTINDNVPTYECTTCGESVTVDSEGREI